VDLVVPFLGAADELERLLGSLERLRLRDGDTVVVVDNGPQPAAVRANGRPSVVHASAVSSPGYARNRGAAEGRADWIVFIDADTVPEPGFLDAYWEPPPGERTALMAGGVVDEPVPEDGPAAARYAYLRGIMAQENTLRSPDWPFPQAANAAVLRSAFEQVGGFREDIRAAEDADLTFRLRAAGWEVERRDHAAVVHRSRQTTRALFRQKLVHGAGGAWLERNYPGSFPRVHRLPGLIWWGVRRAVTGLAVAARRRDRDLALWALYEPLELIGFEFGRFLGNDPPRGPG
jgi:mycofactocin glycosyltransferase